MPVDYTPQAEPMPQSGPVQARLPHHPVPPFYLMFHPARWVFEDGEYLPSLKRMAIEPGVGGVDKTGDSTLAETDHKKKGDQILPWNLAPPGTPGGTYIQRYPCAGGYYHCEFWVTPRQLAGNVVKSKPDLEARKAFLRWLVAEGHVPPISEEAKEALAHKAEGSVRRLEKQKDRQSEAAAARAHLEALRAPSKPAKAKA